ncbi:MAG TPA: metalloregulator ArsR/SmtB family transcription factor [Deinococcales bacterium]|nr:metalloregulator ArsR/SmtB family transcription factor [Deinococcales bacterium]
MTRQDADPATCQVDCVHPEAVARARAAMPPAGVAERASELLKAVADPTRLCILAALAATELCVCDLASIAGTSQSAVSHQLRLLREQRLVAHRKEGRVVYYRLLDAHVTALIQSAVEHAQEPGLEAVGETA